LDSPIEMLAGGDVGTVIAPGDPEKVYRIHAIRHTDDQAAAAQQETSDLHQAVGAAVAMAVLQRMLPPRRTTYTGTPWSYLFVSPHGARPTLAHIDRRRSGIPWW